MTTLSGLRNYLKQLHTQADEELLHDESSAGPSMLLSLKCTMFCSAYRQKIRPQGVSRIMSFLTS